MSHDWYCRCRRCFDDETRELEVLGLRRDWSEDRDDRERAGFDQFDSALDASLYPGTGRNR